MSPGPYSQRISLSLFFALFSAHLALLWYWLRLDGMPLLTDSAGYYVHSLKFRDLLRWNGIHAAISFPLGGISPHPTFMPTLGGFLTALSPGPTADTTIFSINSIFLLIGSCSIYLLARELYGPGAGLLAVFIFLGFPSIFGLSRQYMLDLPAACSAAWGCLRLHRLVPDSSISHFFWAGVVCGLSLACKESALIYIAGPLAMAFFRHIRATPLEVSKKAVAWFTFAAAAVLFAAPFYYSPLSRSLHDIFRYASMGPVSLGQPALGTFANWIFYWQQLDFVVSPTLKYFALAAIPLAIVDKRMRMLIAWIFVIYILASFVPTKAGRFVCGITIPLSILIAGLCHHLLRIRLLGIAFVALISTFTVAQYWLLSFEKLPMFGQKIFLPEEERGSDEIYKNWALRNLIGRQGIYDLPHRPLTNYWPVTIFLNEIKERTGGAPATVGYLEGFPPVLIHALRYRALEENLKLWISSGAYPPGSTRYATFLLSAPGSESETYLAETVAKDAGVTGRQAFPCFAAARAKYPIVGLLTLRVCP